MAVSALKLRSVGTHQTYQPRKVRLWMETKKTHCKKLLVRLFTNRFVIRDLCLTQGILILDDPHCKAIRPPRSYFAGIT